MPYLCKRGLSGPERAVFTSSPSVRWKTMKKIVKSSIFCEKTSKLSKPPSFRPQTIDNQQLFDHTSKKYIAQIAGERNYQDLVYKANNTFPKIFKAQQ